MLVSIVIDNDMVPNTVGAIAMWFIKTWYCIQYYRNWDEIWIRVSTHKRHPIHRP